MRERVRERGEGGEAEEDWRRERERERERERRGREKNVFYSFAHRANRRLLVFTLKCVTQVEIHR